jgi:hypothetical protein
MTLFKIANMQSKYTVTESENAQSLEDNVSLPDSENP